MHIAREDVVPSEVVADFRSDQELRKLSVRVLRKRFIKDVPIRAAHLRCVNLDLSK